MRKRILWVDDEIEYLRSHVSFLESRGYDVTAAENGDAAIRLIRETPSVFDIVLLDKQMPAKSGAATLEEVRALRPDLPVIMITGHQHSEDSVIRAKIDGYLTKPVDPDLVLVECKRIIDSRQLASGKAADKYMRNYTENQAALGGRLSAAELMSLYHSFAKWDVELEGVISEGVRQAHAGIKSDFRRKFCDRTAAEYTGWVNGGAGRPVMSSDIMQKIAVPELREGRGVFMIVLSGMRLDQFLAVEPEIQRRFTVGGTKFMALLPTTSDVCMPTLVSGLYPDELRRAEPGVFKAGTDVCDPLVLRQAMSLGLKRADDLCGGAGLANIKTNCVRLGADTTAGRKSVMPIIEAMRDTTAYTAVTLDMMEFVLGADKIGMSLPKSARGDNDAIRMLTRSTFVNSPIVEMMSAAVSAGCAVILTSDHGHVFCDRPTEIYGTSKIGAGLRSMFGKTAEADERTVFFAGDLPLFRLPPYPSGTKCLLARENYYFTLSEKFGSKARQRSDAFRCGGLSPEEMILPAYVCKPK